MRIITRKRITEFSDKHPNVKSALESWYFIMNKTDYNSLNELKRTFPSVDRIQNLFVFNIGGNKARLVAAVHFNTKMVFIRQILTHSEYDKEKWKKDLK